MMRSSVVTTSPDRGVVVLLTGPFEHSYRDTSLFELEDLSSLARAVTIGLPERPLHVQDHDCCSPSMLQGELGVRERIEIIHVSQQDTDLSLLHLLPCLK